MLELFKSMGIADRDDPIVGTENAVSLSDGDSAPIFNDGNEEIIGQVRTEFREGDADEFGGRRDF